SHAITMHKPLRAHQVKTPDGVAYTSNGTPADCVPLAMLQLMDAPPDLVVSGINLGPNLGDDVMYSGTVAGAMEALFNGVRSFAISLAGHQNPEWEAAANFCAEFAPQMLRLPLPRDTFISINVPNVPPQEIKGVRVTTQGSRRYKGDIVRHEAPQIGVYYWRGGEIIDRSERDDTDILAVKEGYISVTPLHVDLTRYDALEVLKQVF
ncbi:MAG: 5'/3'-nucleotidase SurE, partial [Armatimonadota bacterium]|nr:5'/3'-nucleotidase SurE [Armatimonadota bacterium]